MSDIDVVVREVGLRDGLQIHPTFMPTERKLAWIAAEARAGVQEIEVTSYVPAKVVPQFVDAEAVSVGALQVPGLTVAALIPNYRGAERGLELGVHKLNFVMSASKTHNLNNVRREREESVADFGRIVELIRAQPPGKRPTIVAGLATAFGCSFEGRVAVSDVVKYACLLAEAGADEIGLSDTTGMGNPAQVSRLFKRMFQEIGPLTGAAHMHNTRGLGLANCLAAYEAGVRTFDSSLGGLGGCPYAPGASGNVVTEDLVFMFEAMGVSTGVDLNRLMAARAPLRAGLPGEPLYGMTPEAGMPKGWV